MIILFYQFLHYWYELISCLLLCEEKMDALLFAYQDCDVFEIFYICLRGYEAELVYLKQA